MRTLVCHRVADGTPKAQSVVDRCGCCDAAVWRALSSPEAEGILCLSCAAAEAQRQRHVEIEPPTAEQLRDMKTQLK